MHASRETVRRGQAEVRGGFWESRRGDNEGARVHWPKTKAGHQKKGKSVISWSKPEILVQHKRQIEERKEAAAACKQDYCASQVVALNQCCAFF